MTTKVKATPFQPRLYVYPARPAGELDLSERRRNIEDRVLARALPGTPNIDLGIDRDIAELQHATASGVYASRRAR